jgi:hypothetical protein
MIELLVLLYEFYRSLIRKYKTQYSTITKKLLLVLRYFYLGKNIKHNRECIEPYFKVIIYTISLILIKSHEIVLLQI